MKTKIISKSLLTLALVFVLGSAITHVHGATQGSSPSIIGPPDQQFPVVAISNGTASAALTRGQIGAFVLSAKPQSLLASTFVYF